MTQEELASLSFAELRDRLQARAEDLGSTEDIDLMDVLRYLRALADHAHTPDKCRRLVSPVQEFLPCVAACADVNTNMYASVPVWRR